MIKTISFWTDFVRTWLTCLKKTTRYIFGSCVIFKILAFSWRQLWFVNRAIVWTLHPRYLHLEFFLWKITLTSIRMGGSFEDSNWYWREFYILIGKQRKLKIYAVRKLIQIQNDQQTNYFLRQDLEAVVICEQSNRLNSSSLLSSPGIFLKDFINVHNNGQYFWRLGYGILYGFFLHLNMLRHYFQRPRLFGLPYRLKMCWVSPVDLSLKSRGQLSSLWSNAAGCPLLIDYLLFRKFIIIIVLPIVLPDITLTNGRVLYSAFVKPGLKFFSYNQGQSQKVVFPGMVESWPETLH